MLSRAAEEQPAKTGPGCGPPKGGIRCSEESSGAAPKLDLNQAVQDVRRMFLSARLSYLPNARTGPAEAESSGT